MPSPCAFLADGWPARLADAVECDPEFQHIARWTDVAVELASPEGATLIRVREATVVGTTEAPGERIRLSASVERWRAFFSATPPPWHNDMLGFARRHDDVALDQCGEALVRNLRVLNRLWEVARALD